MLGFKGNNEKFKIENLYVTYVGIKNHGNISSKETIICYQKKDSLGHSIYYDLLGGNKYRLKDDYYANYGENIVFNPISFLSVFKPSEYKDDLLKKKYVTREQLIEIYNALNNNNGYIETREKKSDKNEQRKFDSYSILNEKNYSSEPAIYREQELEKLMISLALNKKIALIVGDRGTGKTAVVDELAYLIQKGKVPDFLKNKMIIEVNIPSLKRKDNKKSTIEDRINNLISTAKENNAILFVDDSETIFTPEGENKEDKNTMELLKYAAEREDIKIIATTNNKGYNAYYNNLDFKRKFDVIEIIEPDEKKLTDIIIDNINKQKKIRNISYENIQDQLTDIITLLIATTAPLNTIEICNEQNPGLVLGIIDKSFAIAEVKKQKELSIDNIKESIQSNQQLDPNRKTKALEFLESLKPTTNEQPKQFKLK